VVVGLSAIRVAPTEELATLYLTSVLGLALASGPAEVLNRLLRTAPGLGGTYLRCLAEGEISTRDLRAFSPLAFSADPLEQWRRKILFEIFGNSGLQADASAAFVASAAEEYINFDIWDGALVGDLGIDNSSARSRAEMRLLPVSGQRFASELLEKIRIVFASTSQAPILVEPAAPPTEDLISVIVPDGARPGWLGFTNSQIVANANQFRSSLQDKWFAWKSISDPRWDLAVPRTDGIPLVEVASSDEAALSAWACPPRIDSNAFFGGQPTIDAVTISPSRVAAKETFVLGWSSSNADRVSLLEPIAKDLEPQGELFIAAPEVDGPVDFVMVPKSHAPNGAEVSGTPQRVSASVHTPPKVERVELRQGTRTEPLCTGEPLDVDVYVFPPRTSSVVCVKVANVVLNAIVAGDNTSPLPYQVRIPAELVREGMVLNVSVAESEGDAPCDSREVRPGTLRHFEFSHVEVTQEGRSEPFVAGTPLDVRAKLSLVEVAAVGTLEVDGSEVQRVQSEDGVLQFLVESWRIHEKMLLRIRSALGGGTESRVERSIGPLRVLTPMLGTVDVLQNAQVAPLFIGRPLSVVVHVIPSYAAVVANVMLSGSVDLTQRVVGGIATFEVPANRVMEGLRFGVGISPEGDAHRFDYRDIGPLALQHYSIATVDITQDQDSEVLIAGRDIKVAVAVNPADPGVVGALEVDGRRIALATAEPSGELEFVIAASKVHDGMMVRVTIAQEPEAPASDVRVLGPLKIASPQIASIEVLQGERSFPLCEDEPLLVLAHVEPAFADVTGVLVVGGGPVLHPSASDGILRFTIPVDHLQNNMTFAVSILDAQSKESLHTMQVGPLALRVIGQGTLVALLPKVIDESTGLVATQVGVDEFRDHVAAVSASLGLATDVKVLGWTEESLDSLAVLARPLSSSDDPRIPGLLDDIAEAAVRCCGYEADGTAVGLTDALWVVCVPDPPKSSEGGQALTSKLTKFSSVAPADAARAVAVASLSAMGALLRQVFVDTTDAFAVGRTTQRLRVTGRILSDGSLRLNRAEVEERAVGPGAPLESRIVACALASNGDQLYRMPVRIQRHAIPARFALLMPVAPEVHYVEFCRDGVTLGRLDRIPNGANGSEMFHFVTPTGDWLEKSANNEIFVHCAYVHTQGTRATIRAEVGCNGVYTPAVETELGSSTLRVPLERFGSAEVEFVRLIATDGWNTITQVIEVRKGSTSESTSKKAVSKILEQWDANDSAVIRKLSDGRYWVDAEDATNFVLHEGSTPITEPLFTPKANFQGQLELKAIGTLRLTAIRRLEGK
jgi:hypothetical protein